MTTQEFLENLKKTFDDCYRICAIKNSDYADKDNPFKNFMNSELIGISAEKGILVRTMDKMTRMSNLLEREGKVSDEKIEDTINDAIGYLAILKALIISRK